MKKLYFILFALVGVLRFAPNAHAVLYWGRAYDPNLQRWIQRDPIGEDGDANLYRFVFNSPPNWIDPFGLDVWIEGPSGSEPAGHQSINVGDPNGDYLSVSFGATGIGSHGLQGTVYEDTEKGGAIDPSMYYATPPEVDAIIRGKLDDLLNSNENKRYPYRLLNANCRTWSQHQFDLFAKELEKHKKGTKAAPPKRTVTQPHSTGISPATRGTTRPTSQPTTTSTSTTEKKISPY